MTSPPTLTGHHGDVVTRERPVITRVAVAFLLFIVWWMLFEVGIRVDDLLRYGTPLLSPFRAQTQLMVRDADGIHGRPNARFRKWILNNEGMRGRDVTRAKVVGTLRVVTVGASETFGLYESPEHEYPRQLQDSLEAMRHDGRCRCADIRRFEVLNGALPGMGLPTVAQDVSNRIRRFGPDAVVLYPSPVQYLDDFMPEPARPDSSPSANQPLGFKDVVYPRAISRLREQVKLSLPTLFKDYLRQKDATVARSAHPADWIFSAIPGGRMSAYQRDLRGSIEAIHGIDATPFIVTHANAFAPSHAPDESQIVAWGRFYPRALPRIILAFDDSAAVGTRDVAVATRSRMFDWHAAARARRGRLFEDFVHMTDVGAGVLAGGLAAEIVHWADQARANASEQIPRPAR